MSKEASWGWYALYILKSIRWGRMVRLFYYSITASLAVLMVMVLQNPEILERALSEGGMYTLSKGVVSLGLLLTSIAIWVAMVTDLFLGKFLITKPCTVEIPNGYAVAMSPEDLKMIHEKNREFYDLVKSVSIVGKDNLS